MSETTLPPSLVQRLDPYTNQLALFRASDAETHVRIARMLVAVRWPLPRRLSVSDLDMLAHGHAALVLDEDRISELMLELHPESVLSEMAALWLANPLLAPRMPLLAAALEAHGEGRYGLAVCALATQLEGVLAVTRPAAERHRMLRSALAELRESAFADPLLRAYLDALPGTGEWATEATGTPLADLTDGADSLLRLDARDSLRAILLMDVLQRTLRFASTPHGRRHHLPGCMHLARARRRRFYEDATLALSYRLPPCSDCLSA